MPGIEWDVVGVGAIDFMTTLLSGTYTEGDSNSFTLQAGVGKIVFNGSFELVGQFVDGGTIDGFQYYLNDELLLETTGYQIPVADLYDAIAAQFVNGQWIQDLIYGNPMTINGSAERDFVNGGVADDFMFGNGGDDFLQGFAGNDHIAGGKGNDVLSGGEGNDILKGGAGKDVVYGYAGHDTLIGGKGADTLSGLGGKDIATGGAGHDSFAFYTDIVAGDLLTITDFVVGEDMISLYKGEISGLGSPGTLSSNRFHIGNSAHDANDRIIYDNKTGALYYDEDGKGGVDQIKFAMLDAHLKLSHHDFEVLPVS